jgi:hypothetical protein
MARTKPGFREERKNRPAIFFGAKHLIPSRPSFPRGLGMPEVAFCPPLRAEGAEPVRFTFKVSAGNEPRGPLRGPVTPGLNHQAELESEGPLDPTAAIQTRLV